MRTKYVQKQIDGDWILVPVSDGYTHNTRKYPSIMPDIVPYMATATKKPTLISSRSAERKYMIDNNLVHADGQEQDVARNKLEAKRMSDEHLKTTLINQLYR